MGYFGTFSFADGVWSDGVVVTASSLIIEIHDSDIATVDYRAARCGVGRCYLGTQPREYFEDPNASDPVDVDVEALRLAEWAAEVLGTSVEAAAIETRLALEGVDPPDVFVEDTVRRLCDSFVCRPLTRSRQTGEIDRSHGRLIKIAAAESPRMWVCSSDLAPLGAVVQLAQVFVATVEGMFVLSRAQRSTAPLHAAGLTLRQLVAQRVDETSRCRAL